MDDSRKINDANILKELISEFQALSTFAETKDWSKRAGEEIGRIAGIVRELDMEIARDAQEFERVKYEQVKKPLVGRLFGGGNNEEKELAQRLERYKQSKSELTRAAIQLQDAIDFTPKSPDEQKGLIKELRLRKKELQEKKREITMVIRGPRSATPPQSAQVETVFDAATLGRRKARYARDAELLPHEKTKDAMERQMAQVDHDILRVEKFNQ